MDPQRKPPIFALFLFLAVGILAEQRPDIGRVSYKATTDYVFESLARPDILYNPGHLDIVKRVDLNPLSDSVETIKRLLKNFNASCTSRAQHTVVRNNQPRIIRIPGKALSVTEGVHLCKEFGKGYKLIELQRKEEVAAFISQAPEGRFSTPAAIYYDLRQHSFVYFSSERAVTRSSAISRFEDGHTIDSYKYWDSYGDYFGQYVVDNSQVYISVTESDTKYDHVFCMITGDIENEDEESSCQEDLNFITDISRTTIHHVERLDAFLANVWRARNDGQPSTRERRGISAGAILSAAIGGAAGVITTKLISAVSQNDDLDQAMSKTEEILGSLTERTNLLDINQKRILLLLEENRRRMGDLVWNEFNRGHRNLIHSQINSLLIHMKDHLDYITYLLSSSDQNGAYNLALDDHERLLVIQGMANKSQVWKGTRDIVLGYKFKMLGPRDLCLVVEVPLAPPLQTIAVVRPFAFPTIRGGTLLSPNRPSRPFLHFHGNFYVTLDLATYQSCIGDGFCSGPYTPEVADDQIDCAMEQFFNNASAKCPRKEIPGRRYLFYTPSGSTLFYTTLEKMRIRFECTIRDREEIKIIKGRGALETPGSCRALSNKAIFSNPKRSNVFLLANETLGPKVRLDNIGKENNTARRFGERVVSAQESGLNLLGVPPAPDHRRRKGMRYIEGMLKKATGVIFFVICISVLLMLVYIVTKRTNPARAAIEI